VSELQQPPRARCEVTSRTDGAVCLTVSGGLDLAFTPYVESILRPAQDEAALVVVDLQQVVFMDSAGLRLLIVADARARRDGNRLVLARPSDRVRRLFELTAMRERLTIDDAPVLVGGAR
jgi:anti-sigma B factor antagonist